MDMIERVAIAIRHHKFARTDRMSVFNPEICTENELGEARAAIEAMREPTDGQRNAYYELSGKTETMFDAHWERAIDAALNPSQT